MKLTSETHRQFLLELLKQTNFPGQFIDLVYEIKQEIEQAVIEK